MSSRARIASLKPGRPAVCGGAPRRRDRFEMGGDHRRHKQPKPNSGPDHLQAKDPQDQVHQRLEHGGPPRRPHEQQRGEQETGEKDRAAQRAEARRYPLGSQLLADGVSRHRQDVGKDASAEYNGKLSGSWMSGN